jgi:hypothetical protein
MAAAAVADTASATGQAEVTVIEMHTELMIPVLVEYNGRPLFTAELSGRPSVTKKVQRSLDRVT